MAESEPVSEAGGLIQSDLHCISCGYNLRGLDSSGQCPECGKAIGRTLAAGPIASRRWTGRLRLSAVIAAVTCLSLVGLGLWCYVRAQVIFLGDEGARLAMTWVAVNLGLGALAAMLALWPQPRPPEATGPRGHVWAAPVVLVCLCGLSAAVGVHFLAKRFVAHVLVSQTVGCVVMLILCLAQLYLLAPRLGAVRLRRPTGIAAICGAAATLFFVAVEKLGREGVIRGNWPAFWTTTMLVTLLVFGLWFAAVFVAYARRL